jgi:metallo-beta-lactamase class B
MRAYLRPVLCVLLVLAFGVSIDVNAQNAEAQAHVAAAKAAARPSVANPKQPFHSFERLFEQTCSPPKLPDQVRQQEPRKEMSWSEWYRPPGRLFDNLYMIGTKDYPVYGVNTSEGVVIIDPGFDYNGKHLAMNLLRFGVDPDNLKYIIVSDALVERYSGASVLKKAYPSARVVMSEAAWDVVARDNNPQQLKPAKDMVVTDGQKLTLGDVTITFYVTPGQTPGTLSMIIEPLPNKLTVASDEDRHVGAFWGGADIAIGRQGVRYFPDGAGMMNAWIASARRFKDIAAKAGADTILTTTYAQGNMLEKYDVWRILNPTATQDTEYLFFEYEGEPDPFVNKDAVNRFFTVLLECYQAQLAFRK